MSIHTDCLTVGYGERVVQRDLSFSLHRGEMVCMLGPNGCGKSTLLRTLAHLQPALSGSFSPSADQAREVALVLTERMSMDHTSVHDVVALGRYPYTSFLGGLTAEDEQIISESLEAVGFSSSTSLTSLTSSTSPTSPPSERGWGCLSDGEKQRVLIAKALAQQTPVILLDEPTAHLDLPYRIRILQLLSRLAHDEGKTILISTHELDLALRYADRILLMTPGQGVLLDTPEALRRTDAFTRAFGIDVFAY